MSVSQLPIAFRCYFNISAPGLEEDAFVTNIRSDMARYPGAVDHFGIEVTEGAAMLNAERAIISVGALRRLGLRIAIDDFGTGYSSLSYLKRASEIFNFKLMTALWHRVAVSTVWARRGLVGSSSHGD